MQGKVTNVPIRKSEFVQVEEMKMGRGSPKIKLVEVMKDMLIKAIIENVVLDGIDGGKENIWPTLTNMLRIYS